MKGRTLTLDTILSAVNYHARQWSPDLVRRQSRDLLRFITMRLYGDNHGDLRTAQLTISQRALADKLGITREWCNRLLAQLKRDGWLTYTSNIRAGGLRTTCTYRIGNMLKRLLIMLTKSRATKGQQKQAVKSPSQVFPLFQKKSLSSFHTKEQPLSPVLLTRIPLLKTWLDRATNTRPRR